MNTTVKLTSIGLMAAAVLLMTPGLAWAPRHGGAMSQDLPPSVERITKREWDRMKGAWRKQTEKWASCNKQAKEYNATGGKRWSLIAHCMKS